MSGIEQLINCKLQLNTIPAHNVNFSTIRFHKFGVSDRNLLTGEGKLEFFSACINNFHIICIKEFHQKTIGHKVEGV